MTDLDKTSRARVWPNFMEATINDGLALGRLGLDESADDNTATIAPRSYTQSGFDLIATASHIRHGEIAVRIDYNIASLTTVNRWLERKSGCYLRGLPGKVADPCRYPQPIHDTLKNASVEQTGYDDRGGFQ